ncbi:MAG: glycosyltransferase family 39 protein, partial [Planctomycetes bacterium]|nr:glycosyltransferase family 39 protein [Planctomycetota bacterium]
MKAKSNRLKTLWLCLLLAGVTFVAFERVRVNEFVNYDDDKYVTKNPYVNEGLSRESIVWAFTKSHASNWHPLTWISHMIDCQLFSTNAAGHHLVNLLLHIANTILLFLLLKWMTGSVWPSVFAAAAFALHPIHVESVAWIAERKDVLSTFFWMLTLWAYIRYARRAGVIRYLLVMAGLCLGLMAKPMVVTLPFVLLLLDYWPLGRFPWQKGDLGATVDQLHQPVFTTASSVRLIGEKIPLIALAAASSVITFIVQRRGGAMVQIEHIPLNLRIPNALVSYVGYLGKMAWPVNLAPLYPFSIAGIPMWQPVSAFAVLLAITVLVLWLVRKRGYLAVGWFWYLGTLVPVIGLVQVGVQSMADRYTYLPSIGISIMIAWSFAELVAKRRTLRPAVTTAAVLVCLIMTVATHKQVRYWKDDLALFEHACKTAPTNYIMQNNLAITLKARERFTEAIEHFKIALKLKTDSYEVHFNLAN